MYFNEEAKKKKKVQHSALDKGLVHAKSVLPPAFKVSA